jgi:hypothetical protein
MNAVPHLDKVSTQTLNDGFHSADVGIEQWNDLGNTQMRV